MNTEHAINSAELTTTVPRKTSKWPFVAVFILLIGFLAFVNLVPDDSRAPKTKVELCIFNAGVNLNGVSIPENPIRVSTSFSVEKLYVCFDTTPILTNAQEPVPQSELVRVVVGEDLQTALTALSVPDATEGRNCLSYGPMRQFVMAELSDKSFIQIKSPSNGCGWHIYI